MPERVGALDLGTTGVRCVIYDHRARPVATAYRELPLRLPQPGWVEQDPEEMIAAARGVFSEALARASLSPAGVAALGITNQRETVVVWDRATGRPLAPAIVWQDRRTAPLCERLRAEGHADWVRRRTGLPLDPYFSATKLAWLLEGIPGLRAQAERGDALWGTVDAWLVWNLTGAHATDPTNASRTLLFDLHRREWDPELLELFGVPAAWLPAVRPSLSSFGRWEGVPVTAVLGDQQAALFGQGGIAPGRAKVTWGTGAFLLLNVGPAPVHSGHGLVATVAHARGEGEACYALEGSVFVAGAAVQWLRDGLGILAAAAEADALAASLPDNDGVYFVPALAGLGAPHWDPHARGTILGLTRGTTRAHLARAALEAIAYQTHDLVRAMEADTGQELRELHVDGGAARSDFLCQFQADVLGIPVLRPADLETTSRGAALAAGHAAGLWTEDEVAEAAAADLTRFLPTGAAARTARQLSGWRRALDRARGWAAPAD
ncbi:glycerol kinase GlpK [Candidatus Bipolaricaulota bacterium]|nr:glycerol kinase GlpK [Candidatus Bipolaricaulota bacterium]